MAWLNSFARGSFQIYAGNTLDAFQPLDFFHFYPVWYDLWIHEIAQALDKLDADNKSYQELKDALPGPSSMRAVIQKTIPSYRKFKSKNPQEVARVTNFFARMLTEAIPEDPFAEESNRLYTLEDVDLLINSDDWQSANLESARAIGRLLVTAGSLTHGLYNDLAADYGWDTYGPYLLGNDQSFLIRHFPDLSPLELWDKKYCASVRELKILGIYEGMDWHISFVGCHTLPTKGNIISSLKRYSVIADQQVLSLNQINELTKELSEKAEQTYQEIRTLSLDSIKQLVLLQECYQLNQLFLKANMPWQPTEEMKSRVASEPLVENLIPLGKMMTSVPEYAKSFGFDIFAQEVLRENITF